MRSIPCHLLVPLLALAVLGGPAGQPGLAIPPPAPDEMRVQEVLAATTLQLAPEGIPFPNPNPLTVHLAWIRVPQGAGTAAAMAAQKALANQLPIGSWVVIRAWPSLLMRPQPKPSPNQALALVATGSATPQPRAAPEIPPWALQTAP